MLRTLSLWSLSPALAAVALLLATMTAEATPANKAALERHYGSFLPKALGRCTTCHLPSEVRDPLSLDEFPHNPFGNRLRVLGKDLGKTGSRKDIGFRVTALAGEDSDGDGITNETELLAGSNPGDVQQSPTLAQLAAVEDGRPAFVRFLASYRWEPFERVQRPAVPQPRDRNWARNPIDAFIAAEHAERGLQPRPEAPKRVLLRRVFLDLIGLSPTPEEQRAFEEDSSPDAYEKLVDRLLNDPRYGERWGRHWMDIWRYSDWAGWTDGKQVRDSHRHIWRWRDWIVESLNADKPYEQMVIEMLAGDELAPTEPDTLRATGFVVRNYKMLSREQWLEDTVKHTSQAFLGVTVGCAKCHDHMTDPIAQTEYYQMRAIFEPHQVRIDRVPGELDKEKDGVARAYDSDKNEPTYFFIRGDQRKPDKDRVMTPGVPKALCADKLQPQLAVEPVKLPRDAASPDRRDFVRKDFLRSSEQALAKAKEALAKATTAGAPEPLKQAQLEFAIGEARHAAIMAELGAEELEDAGKKESEEWKALAREAHAQQLETAVREARLAFHKSSAAKSEAQRRSDEAREAAGATPDAAKKAAADKAKGEFDAATKKAGEAEKALAKAGEAVKAERSTGFKPRPKDDFPSVSTGRRLAFARWVANADNPLTARVAANHLWLRHFGRGIVATPENFGTDGARPSHPALLDWLAAEFMANGWKMKPLHRLIVTSNTYRMASTPDAANAKADPDNVYLWRMPSRRMESELVRDNLLYAGGNLDLTMGGPEIDQSQGLTSKRRSIYLRNAAEKEVEFLKIFDGPSVNECYQRRPSVMPQQSLALSNSELTQAQAKSLAERLAAEAGADDEAFIRAAYARVLARAPRSEEVTTCAEYLSGKAPARPELGSSGATQVANSAPNASRLRENLIRVLFNHHDFVTIR